MERHLNSFTAGTEEGVLFAEKGERGWVFTISLDGGSYTLLGIVNALRRFIGSAQSIRPSSVSITTQAETQGSAGANKS